MMRTAAVFVLGLALWPPCQAHAAGDPAAATVFIRLIGSVRVVSGGERLRQEVLLDLPQVEVGTGSGFVVSAQGYVVTNHHVITGGRVDAVIEGVAVQITVDPQRIEVVLPIEAGRSGDARRYTATVVASDPELDLAVLFVGGSDLPVAALGDSDAVLMGDAVRAIGYPFGNKLEIGKSRAPDAVPDVSINTGSIAAARRNDAGEIRYLQSNVALNPGNSGGPIVDADGYVVAVAQLTLRNSTGVGFGVPINLVKEYLRRHGLDQNLPDQLLSLGAVHDDEARGVQLRIPEGFRDGSTSRLRLDAGLYGNPIALRIDRIATTMPLDQVERALLSEGSIERFESDGAPRRSARRDEGGRQMIVGRVRGTETATNREMALVYALLDFGREKLVARYLGTADAVAMNRSVLQASLASLGASALLREEAGPSKRPSWITAAVASAEPGRIEAPAGWLIESGLPSPCTGLPQPAASLSASPAGDFTVTFRAAWWQGSAIDTGQAARGCSGQRQEPADRFAYESQVAWWGATYQARGVVVAGDGGVWQFEMIAPDAKSASVLPLFERWIKANARR